MNKYGFTAAAVLVAGFAGAVQAADANKDFYASVRLQNAHQEVAGQQAYSPRALNITRDPSATDKLAGSLAVGRHLPGDWRLEAEYALPTSSTFDTQWRFVNPNNGSINPSRNVVETRAQRLMLNAYKDFPLNQFFSLYAGLGLGLSRISANGYQGTTARRFAQSTSNNLAWSATLGMDWRLNQTYTLGAGYRYVDLGKYQTGSNLFSNVVGRRDEQHRGRLNEQNLFAELRIGF
ncbi:porin family protein [Herbaspirillum sp. LeCh32-8]|uniref:outer membrane protein n=1 Tax=Herbaspirillum sp. LeCh32-8 TaxID=2821356 RepID=UPI001AE7F0C9|nr:outer membrane beta-barrel protein [Herbaspirillum sp. LeCh32-8]MBP0598953.1 porin family protein [Herbaspirillum sp. LeCh32-8]